MPKLPYFHANERIDKVDLSAVLEFDRGSDNLLSKYRFLDRQSRIIRGFRIEIPDQNQYPGRVVIHGGFGFQYDGQHVFNEDQLTVSRTITLEGSSTTFYLEVEFIESASDVDARAFWDSTVDQGFDVSGDALPDGQEFSANVATRKTADWEVVVPVSTIGFERDQVASLDSVKIPLIKLTTDAANKITTTVNTNLTTEKAASTMVRYISTTQIVVKEPWLFQNGESISITDSTGSSASSITSVDPETGLMVIAAITAKAPGAIVRVTSGSSPDYVKASDIGRYRKFEVDAASPNHVVDWRDMLFQGDEVHGDILSRGHSTVSERSDQNLQNIKDYIDFLAAQIQELKWGSRDPYALKTANDRIPPGLASSFSTYPRYFDFSGSIQGARGYDISIGDGVDSFGDLVGTDEVPFTQALTNLPSSGGRVFVKRGTYSITNTISITKDVEFVFDENAVIQADTGTGVACFEINNASGRIIVHNLQLEKGSSTPSEVGISFITSDPAKVRFFNCNFTNVGIDIGVSLPKDACFRNCKFAVSSGLASRGILRTTATGSQVGGVFENCVFEHLGATGVTGTCVDLSNGSPTQGAKDLVFRDCEFRSTTGANTAQVNLGAAVLNVFFMRCRFTTGALTYTAHVYAAAGTGLNDIKLIDCVGQDAFTPLLNLNTATKIEVRGYFNNNVIGNPHINLTNCSDVHITKCNVKTNSVTPLTNVAFKFTCTSGSLYKYILEGNLFLGDAVVFNRTTAIMFVVNGGDGFYELSLCNNTITNIECGICFNVVGAVLKYFRNVVIDGNVFDDQGISATVAGTQKAPIFGAEYAQCENFSISDNVISRVNPPNTLTFATTANRFGVAFLGQLNYSNINNNVMTDIGNSSNRVTNTAGIILAYPRWSSINGNNIFGVYGTFTAGVIAAQGSNAPYDINISNNKITKVNASGSACWGVTAGNLSDAVIANNNFSDIGGGTGGAFIGADFAGGTWDRVTVNGNKGYGGLYVIQLGFYLNGLDVEDLSVINNTFQGTFVEGIKIVGDAGRTIIRVIISNNLMWTFSAYGIYIHPNSGTVSVVTISTNTLYGVGHGIYVVTVPKLVIAGNIVDISGTTYNAINVGFSTFCQILNNILSQPSTTTADSIFIGSCGKCVVLGNIIDKDGGTGGTSVNAVTVADILYGFNLIDDDPSIPDSSTQIGLPSGTLIEKTGGTPIEIGYKY